MSTLRTSRVFLRRSVVAFVLLGGVLALGACHRNTCPAVGAAPKAPSAQLGQAS